MKSKTALLEEFAYLNTFVETLRGIEESKWTAPIEEGKWSVRDIVAHMMLWDEYFLTEAIEKIAEGKPITYRKLNFDDFNQNAIEYAKTKTKNEIIDFTIQYRNRIIENLSSLSDEEFNKVHKDGDGNAFQARQYVLDFLWHDNHHIKQMKKFLAVS